MRSSWLVAVLPVHACAPHVATVLAPLPGCPEDTRLVELGGRRSCLETMPVSRGAYRRCADVDDACEAPPFRSWVAFGADHASAPMTPVSLANARAHCKHVGRRLPTSAEGKAMQAADEWFDDAPPSPQRLAFRCATDPASPELKPVSHLEPPPAPESFGVNQQPGAIEWQGGTHARPSLALLDDTNAIACMHVDLDRKNGKHTLSWPALGSKPGRTIPFELRGSVIRFRDGECVEDWAIGDSEYDGGARTYVGGAPWFEEVTCATNTVPFLPRRPPCTLFKEKAALFDDDRVFWLPQPNGACVRAGFQVSGRRSPLLRVEASAGDRFYAVSNLGGGMAFVSAFGDASAISTGLTSVQSSASGHRIGDATLFFDRAACRAAGPAKKTGDGELGFRRRIFAAWMHFARVQREVFYVDPSGEKCVSAPLRVSDGSPFIGTLDTYAFDVDGDGLHLVMPACSEHYELTSHAPERFIGVGGSKLFVSQKACEAERATTAPFAMRCAPRPGPMPPASFAARRHVEGFVRDGSGACGPSTLDFDTSFAVATKTPVTSLDGVWAREGETFDVYEWPWTQKLYSFEKHRWLASSELAIHPTKKACVAAP